MASERSARLSAATTRPGPRAAPRGCSRRLRAPPAPSTAAPCWPVPVARLCTPAALCASVPCALLASWPPAVLLPGARPWTVSLHFEPLRTETLSGPRRRTPRGLCAACRAIAALFRARGAPSWRRIHPRPPAIAWSIPLLRVPIQAPRRARPAPLEQLLGLALNRGLPSASRPVRHRAPRRGRSPGNPRCAAARPATAAGPRWPLGADPPSSARRAAADPTEPRCAATEAPCYTATFPGKAI